ncbi:MAG: TlpA family protein disulfide reductase [Ignavibacteria bacterium]|nr:TlpA family protein disulfide reductase [Ignavibacteria bacterium]
MKLLAYLFFVSTFLIAQPDTTKIKSIDKSKLEKIIAERNGKVLLLNFWATWCVPCREEFPDLVKIAKNYKKKVDVIGISIDFPEDIEKKVLPFLRKQKVNFTNYLNSFDKDEQLINFINSNWSGALPATAIYDVNGKLAFFIEGKTNYKVLSEKLNTLSSVHRFIPTNDLFSK